MGKNTTVTLQIPGPRINPSTNEILSIPVHGEPSKVGVFLFFKPFTRDIFVSQEDELRFDSKNCVSRHPRLDIAPPAHKRRYLLAFH